MNAEQASRWMAVDSSTVAHWESGKDTMRVLNLAAVPPAR